MDLVCANTFADVLHKQRNNEVTLHCTIIGNHRVELVECSLYIINLVNDSSHRVQLNVYEVYPTAELL
jgi:hypothetical protein